jgi:hypothetical protein
VNTILPLKASAGQRKEGSAIINVIIKDAMPYSRMALLKFLPNKDKYIRFMTFRLLGGRAFVDRLQNSIKLLPII